METKGETSSEDTKRKITDFFPKNSIPTPESASELEADKIESISKCKYFGMDLKY